MDFSLDDDHIALRDAVRRFCDAEYPAHERGNAEAPEREAQRHAASADLGLLARIQPRRVDRALAERFHQQRESLQRQRLRERLGAHGADGFDAVRDGVDAGSEEEIDRSVHGDARVVHDRGGQDRQRIMLRRLLGEEF